MPFREFSFFGGVPTAIGVNPPNIVLAVAGTQSPDSCRRDNELFGTACREETAGQAEGTRSPDASFGSRLDVLNKVLTILRCEQAGDITCRILSAIQTDRTAVPASAPVGNGF